MLPYVMCLAFKFTEVLAEYLCGMACTQQRPFFFVLNY